MFDIRRNKLFELGSYNFRSGILEYCASWIAGQLVFSCNKEITTFTASEANLNFEIIDEIKNTGLLTISCNNKNLQLLVHSFDNKKIQELANIKLTHI